MYSLFPLHVFSFFLFNFPYFILQVSKKKIDLNSRKNSTYIVIGIGIVFIIIILFQYFSLKNPSTYSRKLLQERSMKDLQFRNDPESPIKQEHRQAFEGLNYFPIDESYVVDASLRPSEKKDTLRLYTSTGGVQQVIRMGILEFELHGLKSGLLAYKYLDPTNPNVFVPFRDLTSAVSTYGGGRYMDIPISDKWVVDFNTAYNPYCVYNETFSCPLPPGENNLPLEILAGEQMIEFD